MRKIKYVDFIKVVQQFRELEKNGSFYDVAVNLVNNGFKIEAYMLILATWNFGHFRYAVTNFDIRGFNDKIGKLQSHIDKMKNKKIEDVELNDHKDDIKKIYTDIAQIEGVKYTGASKVMHLMNRNVFIMWDDYIRGQKAKRYYQQLEIVKNGYWCRKPYKTDGKGYFEFLEDMQHLFGHLNSKYKNKTRTFAKAIDEYNFVNITKPIQQMKQQEKIGKRK